MRRLLVASLLAAGLASAFAHSHHGESTQVRRRKTMGFGPTLPHAVYNTNSESSFVSGFRATSSSDPYQVAKEFVSELTANAADGTSFYIRDDSYTDNNTGISHIYVRQTVFGVEVADGDINVNVKNGQILSYGDSFFRGATDSNLVGQDLHADLCLRMNSELEKRQDKFYQSLAAQGEQVVLGEQKLRAEIFGNLPELLDWNCRHVTTPYQMVGEGKFAAEEMSADPTQALLQFMIAATPDSHLADDIILHPEAYLSKMAIIPENHLVDDGRVSYKSTIDNVPGTVNPVKSRMAFVQVPTGHGDATTLELVWKFEVEMEDNWYEAAVTNKAPHKIVSVVDWASDSPLPAPTTPKPKEGATYNVFKWTINDPSEGKRTTEPENFDTLASPVGWHALPWSVDPSNVKPPKHGAFWRNTTTTFGNNVFAHENWEGQNRWVDNRRPEGGEHLDFDFEYDPKKTDRSEAHAEAKKFIDAAVTQLFYTSNMVHDLYYRYGFDEVSGNFQQYNFGRGGKENDAVIANAQDGSGFNNANFMTPPDGQNGRCRMYLWNTAIPYRDGDLEAGIVIHELSHGLSTRLTGGPANSGCLGWGESGGMGEGWGDFLATTIRRGDNREKTDYPMGAWAANRDDGIRNYIYSLDKEVNPSTYKTLDKPGYWGVHAIGEVWAQILWLVEEVLVQKHGFAKDLFPPKPLANGTVPEGDFYRKAEYDEDGVRKPLIPKHGNTLLVQLVLNGMKLQPCRPSFFDARDAIIAADKVLTGGENECALWEGFASGGLGPDAKVEGRTPWGGGVRTDDLKVPYKCQ